MQVPHLDLPPEEAGRPRQGVPPRHRHQVRGRRHLPPPRQAAHPRPLHLHQGEEEEEEEEAGEDPTLDAHPAIGWSVARTADKQTNRERKCKKIDKCEVNPANAMVCQWLV